MTRPLWQTTTMSSSSSSNQLQQAQTSFQAGNYAQAASVYQQVVSLPAEASDEQLLRDKEAAILGLGRSYAKLKCALVFRCCSNRL